MYITVKATEPSHTDNSKHISLKILVTEMLIVGYKYTERGCCLKLSNGSIVVMYYNP